MKALVVQDKALRFSVCMIRLTQGLKDPYRVISKQLIRSSTSIGANLEEAMFCDSLKEFKYRLSISYRESKETMYWLKILKSLGEINQEQYDHHLILVDELAKMIYSLKRSGYPRGNLS